MTPDETVRWIDDASGLRQLSRQLAGGSALALDSESNSGFVYRERLCLLQINDGESIWLVDLPGLSGGERALEPLREFLEDPDYRIDLHGGEFDVGCLKRDYAIALRGVWDSQQAASYLGWEKTGYGAVVARLCDVDLPKAHTRHDWSRRPVEGDALRYALNDVRYLPEISDRLRRAVRRADLEEEVAIACGAVEEATWNGGFRPEDVWKIKGARQLDDEAKPLLVALHGWRESVARRLDLPSGRALHNQLLLSLARSAPARPSELKRLGVPRRISERWTTELLRVIAEARRDPPELPPWPARRAFDREAQARGERLKSWRRQEAQRRGVPLQVVLPLVALKHIQQQGADALESVPQLGPKRIALYGDQLRQLVAG